MNIRPLYAVRDPFCTYFRRLCSAHRNYARIEFPMIFLTNVVCDAQLHYPVNAVLGMLDCLPEQFSTSGSAFVFPAERQEGRDGA